MAFGWKAKVQLVDGLAATWEWLHTQPGARKPV